jgi:hypothetical protein
MTKKANAKAVEQALELLANMDENQATEVLAKVEGSALAQALKARKDAEAEKEKAQREAVNKAMSKIGKILDECKVDRSVKFVRDENGSWSHSFLKKGNGGGGSRKGARSGLTDEMRETIDATIKANKVPEKAKENEAGTVASFRFKRNGNEPLEIPTSWICFHLLESGVGTATDVFKLIGHWGVKDYQARSAENRIHGRK